MAEREPGTAGSSFDEFLREQGAYEETTSQAVKRMRAFQLDQAMKDQTITKGEMAKRPETSRSQRDHLLDPENDG